MTPLRPKTFVEQFAETYAREYGIRTVLDIGTGEGRNALRLASHFGMNVLGVDADSKIVETARKRARMNGLNIQFEQADIANYRTGMQFDAVLANEVTHLVPADERTQFFDTVKQNTRPGGFAVMSGYLVKAGDPRAENMFVPGQLKSQFDQDANWRVLTYDELWTPDQQFGAGQVATNSLAEIVAQRVR